MSMTINQTDVMNVLHNLMGHRTQPGGTDEDYRRYIQESFNYCWRYYKWGFSLKKATVAADGVLPTDFDHEGYREFDGLEEIDLVDSISATSGAAVVWDDALGCYKLEPATATTVVYQKVPPTLGTDAAGAAPFPSAAVVAEGAVLFAKRGANPTRADVQQEWDMFHSRLDRLAGRAYNAKPHRPQSYHDKAGSYVGNVGG